MRKSSLLYRYSRTVIAVSLTSKKMITCSQRVCQSCILITCLSTESSLLGFLVPIAKTVGSGRTSCVPIMCLVLSLLFLVTL